MDQRQCKWCGSSFVFTKADHPRQGCCSRECHQAWKVETGRRKQAPPVRNDPAEAGVIYALIDPRTDAVRYIGKARNLNRRVAQYRAGKWHNPHFANWMKQLVNVGKFPIISVLQECMDHLGECERQWIAEAVADGWDLTNKTLGGDGGGVIDDATRDAMRERGKRLWGDPQYVAKVRERHRAAIAPRIEAANQRKAKEEELALCQRVAREAMARFLAHDREANREVVTPLTYRGTAFIHLTHGMVAMVDAGDWERVNRYSWRVQMHRGKPRPKRSCKGDGAELLGRFVCDATAEQEIRSRNGNALDCRRSNLIVGRIGGSRQAA